MMGNRRKLLGIAAIVLLPGCAAVKQKDREALSDPILQIRPDDMGQQMEEENRTRREGAVGGSSGNGGGCGC
jgi:hypothetical protein